MAREDVELSGGLALVLLKETEWRGEIATHRHFVRLLDRARKTFLTPACSVRDWSLLTEPQVFGDWIEEWIPSPDGWPIFVSITEKTAAVEFKEWAGEAPAGELHAAARKLEK